MSSTDVAHCIKYVFVCAFMCVDLCASVYIFMFVSLIFYKFLH